jgi:molecular chaperone DnaK
MIGIDLGTTNSRVAVMAGGVPEVIRNQEGQLTTPSVVSFTADGRVLVGEPANQQGLVNPGTTISAVTRLIGHKYDSPQAREASRFSPFELVSGANGEVEVRIGGTRYSPLQICSLILGKLKAAAEEHVGMPIEEAVLAVPTYLDFRQRQILRRAALGAGLTVWRVVSSSTATALTYGLENSGKSGHFVAVCDLGGGTFDITILEMADGLFQVRAVGGDTYLGGEDFDRRITEWLIGEFQRETVIDLAQDRAALLRLKDAAEKAKCELSTEEETEIVLPFISVDASGPKHLKAVLSRHKYDEMTNELRERTVEACKRCLADAGMRPERIDEVLIVGGQTRDPRVREALRSVLGRRSKRAAQEGIVAMGAAIQTGIIQGEVKGLVLLDVTPNTVGVETKGGTFTPLIERNSTIPTRKSQFFTTAAEDQTRVEVHVLEGESDVVGFNISLARFELAGIPVAPKGRPQIEITFEIDVNGVYAVSARDQNTGGAQGTTIHPFGGPGLPPPTNTSGDGEPGGLVLLPVVPHTLGVETEGGSFTPLIRRNRPLPAHDARLFTTVQDSQSRIEVHILGGENDLAAYNTSLVRLELADLTPLPKGTARIEIAIDVDEKGLLSVVARDLSSGRCEGIVLPSSKGVGLSDMIGGFDLGATRAPDPSVSIRPLEEGQPAAAVGSEEDEALARYLTKAEKERADQISRVAMIRQLAGLILNTSRSLQALDGKLTQREQRGILDAIERAKKASSDTDSHGLTSCLVDLEKAAGVIGQAMLRP